MTTKITGSMIAQKTIGRENLSDSVLSGKSTEATGFRRMQNPFVGPTVRTADAYRRKDINPVIEAQPGDNFVADPFAIVVPEHGGEDGRVYVFYEAFVYNDPHVSSQGRIKVSYTDDGENFTLGNSGSPVVNELPDYHSAYPQVFRVHDTFYMAVSGASLPGNVNDVRFYKTTLANFPTGWTPVGRPAALNTFGGSSDFDYSGLADFTFFQANGQWCCIYGGTNSSRQKPGFAVNLSSDLENLARWFKQDRAAGWTSSDPRPGFVLPSSGMGHNMRPGGDVIQISENGFVCFMQANSSALYNQGQSVVLGLFQKGPRPNDYYEQMAWNTDGQTGAILPYLSPTGENGDWDKTAVHHLSFVHFKSKWLGFYDGRNHDEVLENGQAGPWRIGLVELPAVMP